MAGNRTTGWIKLHRKMLEWQWYGDVNTTCVFLHLLLLAAPGEEMEADVPLLPGDVLTSIRDVAEALHITFRGALTAINRLKRTGEIALVSSSKRGAVYRIVNWQEYQLEPPKRYAKRYAKRNAFSDGSDTHFKEENGQKRYAFSETGDTQNDTQSDTHFSENPTSTEGAHARKNTKEEEKRIYNIHTCRYAHSGAAAPVPPPPPSVPPYPQTPEEVLEIAGKFGYDWKPKDAMEFIYFNRSIGWKVSGQQIEDWRYLLPKWERNRNKRRQ